MTRFVSVGEESPAKSPNLKYVKQTQEALSNSGINLELVAIQIGMLPVREQLKFFRLLLNYIDITAQKNLPTMSDIILLCEKIIDVVNEHYEEQDQLAFEGM